MISAILNRYQSAITRTLSLPDTTGSPVSIIVPYGRIWIPYGARCTLNTNGVNVERFVQLTFNTDPGVVGSVKNNVQAGTQIANQSRVYQWGIGMDMVQDALLGSDGDGMKAPMFETILSGRLFAQIDFSARQLQGGDSLVNIAIDVVEALEI